MGTNSMMEAALDYCRNGYSIIPVQPNKKPALPGWEEFESRRATEDEIRKWWSDNPNSNIALICGKISGVVAVDVDTYRGGDPSTVFDMAPTSLISKTGRGGYHMLYKYSDSVSRNKVGKDGVDIRSNGGYIVVPPSVHSNGNRYEWVRSGNAGTITSRLINYVDKPQSSDDKPLDGYDRWIADALQGVGSGSRNDTCARLAGYYAGKGIPKDVAVALLSSWNNNNNPPLDNYEIITTVDSVYKTSYRYNPPAYKDSEDTSHTFTTIGFNSFMSKYGSEAVKWIVSEWLPEDTISFIASPPGTYKTWMLLDLAVSVATGTKFMGMFDIENPGPVMLIQQEDHHGGLAERIGVIINSRYKMLYDTPSNVFGFTPPPPEPPIYIHTDRLLKFNDKAIMDSLEKEVERVRPKLVIIDPLYSAAETDDYMAKSAGDMFRLKKMRDKYHCTFTIAHHKKKKAEGNEREGLWGSQFLNAFLETGWQIRQIGESIISVRRHFKVKKESEELNIRFDVDTENFPYRYNVSVNDDNTEREMDIMKELQNGPLTLSELVEKLGTSRSTVSRRLKLLLDDKVVVKDADGKLTLLENVTEF